MTFDSASFRIQELLNQRKHWKEYPCPVNCLFLWLEQFYSTFGRLQTSWISATYLVICQNPEFPACRRLPHQHLQSVFYPMWWLFPWRNSLERWKTTLSTRHLKLSVLQGSLQNKSKFSYRNCQHWELLLQWSTGVGITRTIINSTCDWSEKSDNIDNLLSYPHLCHLRSRTVFEGFAQSCLG